MTTSTSDITADAARFSLDVSLVRQIGREAAKAKKRAYCPYSQFRVGCALLTTSGTIITGVNVENASYPIGTCAERCALGKAVSGGHTSFAAIAVSTDIYPPASPCGMCRQFIREFCGLETPIFMYGVRQDGKVEHDEEDYLVRTLGELLPNSFGPEQLKPKPPQQAQQPASS